MATSTISIEMKNLTATMMILLAKKCKNKIKVYKLKKYNKNKTGTNSKKI